MDRRVVRRSPLSDEHKRKISEKLKGRKQTPEFIAKRIAGKHLPPRPVCKDCGGYKANRKADRCRSCLDKFNVEERNQNWKGDGVGYRTLHTWVEKHLGKPRHCAHCHSANKSPRNYQWCNISHAYKRELSDWIRLCAKCHSAYDRGLINLNEL